MAEPLIRLIWVGIMLMAVAACDSNRLDPCRNNPACSVVYNPNADLVPVAGTGSLGSGKIDVSATIGASTIDIAGYFSNLSSTPISAVVTGSNRTCDQLKLDLDPGGKSGRVFGTCAGGLTQAEQNQYDSGQVVFVGTIKTTNFPSGEVRGELKRR